MIALKRKSLINSTKRGLSSYFILKKLRVDISSTSSYNNSKSSNTSITPPNSSIALLSKVIISLLGNSLPIIGNFTPNNLNLSFLLPSLSSTSSYTNNNTTRIIGKS
jgi:hypothetical protein